MNVRPFERPPRLTKAQQIARCKRGRLGNCYRYAGLEALAYVEAGSPRPTLKVVHGQVGACALAIRHAWVERGGYSYDWQMFALAGHEPMPIAEFYTEKAARAEQSYTAREVVRRLLASGRYGPWA